MADDQEPQDWLGNRPPIEGDGQPQQPWQAWQTTREPQPPLPVQQAHSGSARRHWAGAGLVAAGLVAGGVMAGTLGASAASSSNPGASYNTGGYARGTDADRAGDNGHDQGGVHGLDLSGTVTAVGTSSVTIKTPTGTTTYAVSSTSDIDKNGEAKLSNLVVGDAVRFSTTTSGSTVTIDKLHAGNEALDRPQGGPTGG